MFGFCNGKIILFTEINNSKRGYPTFWTAPFRLLECGYREAQLETCRPILPISTSWAVETEEEKVANGISYTFTFTARQALVNVGVAVAFDENDWSSDNSVSYTHLTLPTILLV